MQLSILGDKTQKVHITPTTNLQEPAQQHESNQTQSIAAVLICKQEKAMIGLIQAVKEVNVEGEGSSFHSKIENKTKQVQVVPFNEAESKQNNSKTKQTDNGSVFPQKKTSNNQTISKSKEQQNPENFNQKQNQSFLVKTKVYLQHDFDQNIVNEKVKQKTQTPNLRSLNKDNPDRQHSQSEMISNKRSRGGSFGKKQGRKNVLQRTQAAESQMMANIEFLKSLKEKEASSSPKYWKQELFKQKNPVEMLKYQRRKYLGSLGFASPTQRLPTKDYSMNSQSSVNVLPQMKKITKKEKTLTLRPVIFSVYSIQKDNEVFHLINK